MDLYYLVTFFIIGTLFGSFYNVVGYRLPKEESIVFPPSHCPNCKRDLTYLELIPIFSYIIQRGKCRGCGLKISLFYPFFELLTGILFALSFYVFGFSYELIIALIFVSMTLIIIISDYKYYIIPDEVIIFSLISILIVIFIQSGLSQILISLKNGVIAFSIMFALKIFGDFMFKKESMGGGDIKLLFIYGIVLGWQMSLISIFIAAFIGLPISVYILYKRKESEKIIPFGPFLSIAALIILFFNLNIDMFINLFR